MKSFLFLVFAIVVLATAPTPAKAQDSCRWCKGSAHDIWGKKPAPVVIVVVKEAK